MNLPNFWYGSCSYGPLWENHTLYTGKSLIWRNFVHLRPFLGQFWQLWGILAYLNAAMNLPNFWYGRCSYGHLWENHTLYAGKILIWRNLVHIRPFFGQNWQFWEFLTYNFQTQLWIFYLVWNFFEFWLFPGNQSYCVLLPITSKCRYGSS